MDNKMTFTTDTNTQTKFKLDEPVKIKDAHWFLGGAKGRITSYIAIDNNTLKYYVGLAVCGEIRNFLVTENFLEKQ